MLKNLLNKLCERMIKRSCVLYDRGEITYDELKDREFFWSTIYAKWVRGECHHVCIFCQYKYECWSNAKEK